MKHPSGTFNCPNDNGSATIIALRYAQRAQDVDIWFATTGCQTLDNGYVSAFEGANPSFYDRFATAFQQVTA